MVKLSTLYLVQFHRSMGTGPVWADCFHEPTNMVVHHEESCYISINNSIIRQSRYTAWHLAKYHSIKLSYSTGNFSSICYYTIRGLKCKCLRGCLMFLPCILLIQHSKYDEKGYFKFCQVSLIALWMIYGFWHVQGVHCSQACFQHRKHI